MEAGGGREVELLSKTLQVEHKLFYFDLKENPRGKYLKISEKTATNRSTIIVPVAGITWFLDLFNFYVSTPGEDDGLFNKELQLDTKVFYFDVGSNRRGRFLKISEASASRTRSTIIVPAGSTDADGWTQFRDILVQINEEASPIFMPQNQQNSERPKQLLRLLDDVGAGFIQGGLSQATSEKTGVPSTQDMGSFETSKVLHADRKRFFFDLGSNSRG